MLGVGSTTVKRWADDGLLLYYRTPGGHRRFQLSEVEDFAARHNGRLSTADAFVIGEWFELLRDGELADVIDEVGRLPKLHRDWFAAGDILGAILSHLGQRWDDEKCSILEANVISAKLTQAVLVASAGLRVAQGAPRALVAAVPGDRHAVGAAIAQLCLRSHGFEAFLLGNDIVAEQLKRDLADSGIRLLVVSAPSWQTDEVSLKSYYRHIAPVCSEAEIELVLGGDGNWPEAIDNGLTCRTFEDFRDVLDTIESRPDRLT